jgi:hypothetical protein
VSPLLRLVQSLVAFAIAHDIRARALKVTMHLGMPHSSRKLLVTRLRSPHATAPCAPSGVMAYGAACTSQIYWTVASSESIEDVEPIMTHPVRRVRRMAAAPR